MKPSPEAALAVLEAVEDGAVAWTHGQGHRWLRTEFLPSLAVGEAESFDPELLSVCCYVLGDVHDFNHAPLAAIEAYRRAIGHVENFSAYREIGVMLTRMGHYDEALHYLQIALRLNPADEESRTEIDWVTEHVESGDTDPIPLFETGDKIWQCDELLAQNDALEALRMVADIDTIDAIKARARCYGALEDTAGYLSEWRILADTEGVFELSWSDWFYLPDAVDNGVDFWRILRGMLPRMKRDVFISHDSWYDSEKLKSLPKLEQYRLLTDFNIAANSGDEAALAALVAEYPEWVEAKEALAELTAGQ